MAASGTVKVSVVCAKGLKSVQLVASMMDPYATVKIGKQEFRTATATNQGRHPSWGEDFTFEGLTGEEGPMEVTVFNEGYLFASKSLGKVEIPLETMVEKGSEGRFFKLCVQEGVFQGEVFFKYQVENLGPTEDADVEEESEEDEEEYEIGKFVRDGFGYKMFTAAKRMGDQLAVAGKPYAACETVDPLDDIEKNEYALPIARAHAQVPPALSGDTARGEEQEELAAEDFEYVSALTYLPKAVLFDKIEPNDIGQGLAGDCWFLAALAALADLHSISVRNLFVTKTKPSKDGGWRLKFYKNGRHVQVVVDDHLYFDGDTPAYARNHGDELWVLLVEKAYAKLHGSYTAITGGNSAEALMDLTGQPAMSLGGLQNVLLDELWQDLQHYSANHYIMCCGSSSDAPSRNGIKSNHAYTLLKVVETEAEQENGLPFRFLQIRNPWGNAEWLGAWSDGSQAWKEHPDVMEEISPDFANDGVFWMLLEDFVESFTDISVCFNTERLRATIPLWFDADEAAQRFSLTIPEDEDDVIVTVHQEDPRMAGANERLLQCFVTLYNEAGDVVDHSHNLTEIDDDVVHVSRDTMMYLRERPGGSYTLEVSVKPEAAAEMPSRLVLTVHSGASPDGVECEKIENGDPAEEDGDDTESPENVGDA